jgi:tight adherence protein C
MQAAPPSGPTILGFDVIWIATMLSAVATMAVMLAIYAATTVKDPMARRVKALNERREQLKAGIVASTNKRKKLTNRTRPPTTFASSCRSSRCFRTTRSRRRSSA